MNSDNHIINKVIVTQVESHNQQNAQNNQTKDQNSSNNNNTNNNDNNNNSQISVNNNLNNIIDEDNILIGLKNSKDNKHYVYPWKSIKSHRGKITHIKFNKDTNLIFNGEMMEIYLYIVYKKFKKVKI